MSRWAARCTSMSRKSPAAWTIAKTRTRRSTTQYGPAHPLRVADGGMLARLAVPREFSVNSLHARGSTGWHPRCMPMRWPPTARSRRFRSRRPKDSCSACNGIPNGAGPGIRFRARSCPRSAMRVRARRDGADGIAPGRRADGGMAEGAARRRGRMPRRRHGRHRARQDPADQQIPQRRAQPDACGCRNPFSGRW